MNDLHDAVMHDVKNQLAELALRLRARGDASVEMDIAMSASRRLTEMLLLGRADLCVNIDSVNPADFLNILAAEYAERFPNITIRVETVRAPESVFFDDALIRLALGNALHNACHYAKSCVQLTAFEQDNMLILEVCDDGPGFPASQISSDGTAPSAVSRTGTGLGLHLAHKIAGAHRLNDHRGYIQLHNDESGGIFRMLLP